MKNTSYKPIFQLSRGQIVESIHHGAVAVVDASGKLIAHHGDPETVTYLRSSAKPFQVMPLIENHGQQEFGFTLREIAIMCASHSGTDEHVAVLRELQEKIRISENDLCCGVHFPLDEKTTNEMRAQRQSPTPIRHNCSGKHTGMLALAGLLGKMDAGCLYIDPDHPIQKMILQTFADMCSLPMEKIAIGTDGCSAPNFAIPLKNTALAFARLSDPVTGKVKPEARVDACQTIYKAMSQNPFMVAGPSRFDTRLMEVGAGRLVAKGGAEGYQGIGIMPGVMAPGSPGLGIAFKIADGDSRSRICPAVALEILRHLRILDDNDLGELVEFGPSFQIFNWRKIHVGYGKPLLQLELS